MSRLMYIWDNNEKIGSFNRAQSHVDIARNIGFEVLVVTNRPERSAEKLQGLFTELGGCVGLWLDMPASDVGVSITQLIEAAHDAGLKLMAHPPSEGETEKNLKMFIGLPERLEAQPAMNDAGQINIDINRKEMEGFLLPPQFEPGPHDLRLYPIEPGDPK